MNPFSLAVAKMASRTGTTYLSSTICVTSSPTGSEETNARVVLGRIAAAGAIS